MLLEAGARILPSFAPSLASRATRELERLGVQVWTHSRVTGISPRGVRVGEDQLTANTVLWAAGVQASPLGRDLGGSRDPQGRVLVSPDLSVPGRPEVFVVGDQAHFCPAGSSRPLPGVATVALQQGRHVAQVIRADLAGRARAPFLFRDKGQMAAIGRRRAVMQRGRLHSTGMFSWLAWLLVHIYFLSGFRSRLLVVLKWGWSYLTFARGSRLIQSQGWRSYPDPPRADAEHVAAGAWAPPSRPPASGLREVEEEGHTVNQSAVSLAP